MIRPSNFSSEYARRLRSIGFLSRPSVRSSVGGLVAFVFYTVVSFLLFAAGHSFRDAYMGIGPDPVIFIWCLNWWPWALAHGINPFITKFVWYPAGANLTWFTSVPAAAFLTLPITLLWGPIVSWNVLSMLAPVLGAISAFLLTLYLTRNTSASLFGGYLFGFSTYESAQLLGHLHLDLVFVPPLLVWISLARLHRRLARRSFIALATPLLLVQLGLSTEVFATSVVFGTATWLVFFMCATIEDRHGLWHLGWEICITMALVGLIASPFLYYVVVGARDLSAVISSPQQYSADLLNYIIPTPVTRLGHSVFADIARRFTGNFSESGAYLGLPLIILLAGGFSTLRQRVPLTILFFLLVICSLGPSLWVNGINTDIWLPWRAISHLPIIRYALPVRFTMFAFLVVSITIALWLADARSVQMRVSRYALATVACLFLLPIRIPWTRLPTVPFFEPGQITRMLPEGDNVIILPFDQTGAGLIWQIESGMYFTQTGGYFGWPPAAFAPDAATIQALVTGIPTTTFANDITAFAVVHHVSDVLAGPGTPPGILAGLDALRWPSRSAGGVRVFQVPDTRKLQYVAVRGDYWSSTRKWNWMGRHITISTHNRAARLLVKGYQPVGNGVKLRVSTNGKVTDFTIEPTGVVTLDLPMNADVSVEASPTFNPNAVIHNGDSRILSVLISLQPL